MNYNKLEEIRKVRKLSRQEMVDVVDISISTYKQNLSKKNMTIAVLERIASVLEVPITDFFTELKPNQEYKMSSEISWANEYNTNTLKNMNRLIESNDRVIALQDEKIEMLEMKLAVFELGKDLSKDDG